MMRFRLLGPVEIREGESWRAIGAPKWRALLAVLLIHANQVVSVDTLIDELWGEAVPAKAGNLVSIYVLRLRRMIGDADGRILVTRSPGYLLRTGDDGTDVQVFEAKTREGRRALAKGAPDDAARHLAEALGLWRGTPLADVPRSAIVEAEAERLSELRLDTAELRITAELACGEHAQVVPELRRLLADNPLREGLWVLLMQALDGSGRHAEALDAYGQARTQIADELGVDPGPELRRLYAKLLAADTDSDEEAGPPGEIIAGSLAQPAEPAAVAPHQATQRPAQLPTDIADFTGREDQVRHLSDTLSAASDSDSGAVRIALVAGYGGLGKTSLAIHAAHRVRSQFPDGQLYVDLLGATAHPLAPGDVLGRFLRDLGIDGRDIPVDEAERAARYRTALAGRQVLIVLDNARDAAQVRSLLPGSASCAVLITTRSRMPDLASTRLVDLNVLDDMDALTLFTKVVGDKRAATEPEATAELLDACGGLPLAIRICAARLATRPGWTIRTMANRLRDEHRRLDELAVGDLAVRASFEVSFASLPARKRGVAPARAFCLLGLWQGPTISCAAAAALFGASDDDATDVLELLVDANLLECVAPDRYKFHDLLRVYAAERALADIPEQERSAAVVRLLTWYLHTADAAGTAVAPNRYNIAIDPPSPQSSPASPASPALSFAGPEDALAWYDGERYNVVAVTRQAASQGLHDIAWRFPPPLWMLFHSRDNWADSIAAHQIALESARAAGNQLGEAWILNNLGASLGFTEGREAVRYLEQAMALRRELGDRQGEAQSANNLADHLARLGRREEGVDMLHRALELNREIGHRYGEAVVLVNLGDALLGLDRPREALPWLHQAYEVFAEVKDPDGLGFAAHARGRCYMALGRESEAVDSYHEALASHQSSGNRQRQAVTLRFLGRAHAQAGRIDRASESLAQSAAIYRELGDNEQADSVGAELADLTGEG